MLVDVPDATEHVRWDGIGGLQAEIESDLRACRQLVDKLGQAAQGRVRILSGQYSEMEIKWVIAQLKWFCGTRMHSTIASLSSGVPSAAIAYRDKTRPLAITVTPVPCELNGQISFEIRDTGLGIHADHCEAVFGLFRRLHTHGEIPGNGMGLPLTRRIVDRHGGRIHLSSVPGAGTTITISLPEST